MLKREPPPARPHGELRELFDDVFFVTGTARMAFALSFSRNMVVVRDGKSLSIINSMRLDEAGLAALDALGKVEHVLRVAGFHGMDDPFYKERYGAKVWAIEGQTYFAGIKPDPSKIYFEADAAMTRSTDLPIPGASLHTFDGAAIPEGLIVLEREGGIVVSGDSMQNWATTDRYFSLAGKALMKTMGFIAPHNLGPGWLDGGKPTVADVQSISSLSFEHVLPVHGSEVIGNAKELYRPTIEKAVAKLSK